jgi:hypothetical protein
MRPLDALRATLRVERTERDARDHIRQAERLTLPTLTLQRTEVRTATGSRLRHRALCNCWACWE